MFSDTDFNIYYLSDIEDYELLDKKTSAGSIVARAGAAALVVGPLGLAAGLTAKKKYTVLLKFRNGNKSVVKLNEKNLKILIENV